jgi:hypothetical protein
MRSAQKLSRERKIVDEISAARISVASFCALPYQHTGLQVDVWLRKHLSGKS